MTNDEPSSLKKKSNGGKNESSVSGSGSGDTVGLRRSARETPKKNNKSSPSSVSVRKSQRLDHGTPLKNQSAKKKIETESPLRRSERENKFQSKGSKTSEKGSTARGKGVAEQGKKSVEAGQKTSDSKDKKDNSVRENVEEQGKKSVEVGSKRKSRLDARCYRKMFKPLKKAKFSDSAKKKLEISGDSGDSGSDNDAEGQRKDSDGEEVEEDVNKDIDEDESVSGSDVEEKHVNTEKPCEFEGPKHSKVLDTGNQSSPSPRIKAKRNKAEGMEVDCAIIGKNKRVHNQEGNLVSNKVSSDGNVSRCNQEGATLGSPVDRSCDKCFRKKRLDHDFPEEGLCCCLSNSMNNVDIISLTKDRGECGTIVTSQSAEKHDQDVQLCDSSLDVDRSTCASCKREGKLLYCCGKGCKRSYHPSCLLTPEADELLASWYCSQCIKKRLSLGEHSVSEGIESVLSVREVQLSTSEGKEKQKQCFVKYKGLAHIHNHWVPEMQLIHEVPELVAKFSERNEGQWKPEWAMPHRLLLKRSIIIDDLPAKYNDEDAGIVSNGQCEWLVKWCGLDYDQASWELEESLFLKAPDMQRFIREYETRHDRARMTHLSRGDEIQEKRKGSHVKLGRHSSGGLSGADSCYLNAVNKLREHHYRGHNAVLLDEQDSVLKVTYLISSLLTTVNRPFLIITSYASLSHWEAEFMRIDSSVNVVVYGGSMDARKMIRRFEFYEGGSMMLQVLLSSVEVIFEDLEEFEGVKWEAVIVDDSQKSCIWAHSIAIKSLVTDWRVLLIHAQLKDDVAEYMNILSLLEPGGNSNQNSELTVNSSGDIDTLKERLSSFVVCARFLEYWVPVPISNVQLEQYCSLILSNSAALRSFSKTDPVGSLREILISTRKCCDHPYVVDLQLQKSLGSDYSKSVLEELGIRASGKLLLLDKILSELKNQKLKVLILFQSISGSGRAITGDILDDFLRYRFGLESYEHVDSGCLSSKKQAALNRFNKENERSFFILETRACLPSVKLSSIHAVILFDSDWNPLNDVKALHRIIIDSKLEQIKVFRLYCSCTVEEKVLILAKNDMILDSTLQGISPSTNHMLLMWGSSYLFSKLGEFHREDVPDWRDNIVPEDSFLKDVCEEFLSLFQHLEAENSRKFISVARQNGGSYLKNTVLLGEQQIQLEDGVPPHVFWMKLLEGKQPQWKYLSGSSQRNRKRVNYLYDSSTSADIQSDEVAKKRKKMDSSKLDFSPRQVGENLEKLNAADKDSLENIGTAKADNSCMATGNTGSEKGREQTSPILTSNIPRASDVMTNEQKELLQLLKPTVLRLCEIMLLKDDGKILAEQFLGYIVSNHRVTREPETILQAFQISVCWTVAALVNQKIDHTKSLAIAREKMNFSCREDEADFLYSKMKLLKKMFLLRSEVFKVSNASKISSATNGVTRGLRENGIEPEEKFVHTDGLDKEVLKPLQTTDNENDILRHIRKVRKKCDKHMERLKNKHNEELEEFKKTWDEERAELEKKYRMESAVIRSIHNKSSVGLEKLKILDSDYAEKRKNMESQISNQLKELETKQQAERSEQQKKAAGWLEQVKSLVQNELLDKPASENGPAAEHNESCKRLNGNACTTSKLQKNSDSGTSRTVRPDMAPLFSEVAVNLENIMTTEIQSSVPDKQTLICQDDVALNTLGGFPMPKEVGSGNLTVESLLEEPPATTREMERNANQIHFAEVATSSPETNLISGTNTSLHRRSTEPMTCPSMSLTEQATDRSSIGLLPLSQELQDGSCRRLVDGAEEWVQPISESVPSNLSCDRAGSIPPVSAVSPHDDNQTIDASSGRLDNEHTEVLTSAQGTNALIQQERNSANTSTAANSQPASVLAVDHADANLGQRETHPSTRDAFSAHVGHANPLQVPRFNISQLPSMSLDPLQNEWERIGREINEVVNTHEEMKLRLISERDKEIEEIVTEIHKKYDGKRKEADASFSQKRNELQMIREKVMMHKFLAEAFKSKCADTKATPGMQQSSTYCLMPSGSMEPIVQLPATRPTSIAGSFPVIPHNATPPVRPVRHPVPANVSTATTRSPHINPIVSAPTAVLQQVRGHPQSFKSASLPMSSTSSSMPSVSSSLLGQQPPGNTPASSLAPLRPPQLQQMPPNTFHRDQTHQGENMGIPQALNLSLSATELLMQMGRQSENLANNLPPLPDNVRNSESWDISEFGTAANMQLPPLTLGAVEDVVCLSDDD